jgi:predicted permease
MPRLIEHLSRDTRHGVRQLARTPAFTLFAVTALSLGIGAAITIFGFVSALIFRPVDADEPGRLVRVFGEGSTRPANIANSEAYIPLEDYFEYRDRNQTFSSLAAQYVGAPASVRTAEGPARMIPVTPVSANYFSTVGVPAAMGRTFAPDDLQERADVIVLSDAGWRRFFNADPAIIGKVAVVDGIPRTIIGVTPAWFSGTALPVVPQIYMSAIERSAPGSSVSRAISSLVCCGENDFRVWMIGRLKPGVTHEQVLADLRRVATQLTATDRRVRSIEVHPATALMPPLFTPVYVVGGLFAVIVGVVFLIACDNIAVLYVVRSAARRREVGIRIALGARPSRLVLQFLIETLLLCAAAGVGAVTIAYAGARYLTQLYAPVPMPFALQFTFDWRVALFGVGLSSSATLLCGLAPALQAVKTDVLSSLHSLAASAKTAVRPGLIVTQVTLSTALLVAAVALAHSLTIPVAPNSGLISDGVVLSTINLPPSQTTFEQRAEVLERLLGRLEGAPGIGAVTVVDNIPVANSAPLSSENVRVDGRLQRVFTSGVSRGLFETLKIPLLAGRDFTALDGARARSVGIVNQTLARLLALGGSPVGRQIQSADGTFIEVIGVAADSQYSAQREPMAFLYRPIALRPPAVATFMMRTSGDAAAVFAVVRSRIAEINPDLVPYNLITFNERLGLALIANRAAAALSGSLGVLVLLLGSVGIFGTMALVVQQRTRELGLRSALGASPRQLLAMVMRQGLSWTGPGLVLGIAAGVAATFGLSRVLRGIAIVDPYALVITPLLLATMAALACLIPGRRAARIDPLTALKEE